LAFRPDDFIHIGNSRRGDRAALGRASPEAGIGRQWVRSEHRKNAQEFPVLLASHQRFVAERVATAGAMAGAGNGRKQKGRRKAGLLKFGRISSD
jgi:hypothetical protein